MASATSPRLGLERLPLDEEFAVVGEPGEVLAGGDPLTLSDRERLDLERERDRLVRRGSVPRADEDRRGRRVRGRHHNDDLGHRVPGLGLLHLVGGQPEHPQLAAVALDLRRQPPHLVLVLDQLEAWLGAAGHELRGLVPLRAGRNEVFGRPGEVGLGGLNGIARQVDGEERVAGADGLAGGDVNLRDDPGRRNRDRPRAAGRVGDDAGHLDHLRVVFEPHLLAAEVEAPDGLLTELHALDVHRPGAATRGRCGRVGLLPAVPLRPRAEADAGEDEQDRECAENGTPAHEAPRHGGPRDGRFGGGAGTRRLKADAGQAEGTGGTWCGRASACDATRTGSGPRWRVKS